MYKYDIAIVYSNYVPNIHVNKSVLISLISDTLRIAGPEY